VHAKLTGELISFGFSDRSVRSLVSAKRSAKTTSLVDWSLISRWCLTVFQVSHSKLHWNWKNIWLQNVHRMC